MLVFASGAHERPHPPSSAREYEREYGSEGVREYGREYGSKGGSTEGWMWVWAWAWVGVQADFEIALLSMPGAQNKVMYDIEYNYFRLPWTQPTQ